MSGQERPDNYNEISIIEDLDPEPARRRWPGLRLDLLLGIPLLLAVILFAGWQWWHQSYQSSQYRAGQEAEGRNDWDTALHDYREASGYSNADELAQSAQRQIDTRNQLYTQATTYSNQGNWVGALSKIREAARIQPDYRDLPQMEQTTLDRIYTGVLSGTVTLRTGVNPQGLYYRTAKGWTYLNDSDRFSALQTSFIDGQFIYDAPDEGWVPLKPNDNGLRGRHLIYAHHTLSDTIEYVDLSLDPSYYSLLAGTTGVWGIHYNNGYIGISNVVREGFADAEIAYQPYSSAPTVTVGYAPMPGVAGARSVVVNIDPSSSRYLVAGWTSSKPTSVGPDTVVNLYLAVAGTNDARLIYTHKAGGLVSAQFSPDGRYVMVHTFTVQEGDPAERQSILLIDLQDTSDVPTPQVILDELVPDDSLASSQAPINSSFVTAGPFAGDIILTHFRTDHTLIQLLKPSYPTGSDHGLRQIAQATPSDTGSRTWLVLPEDSNDIVLAGFEYMSSKVPQTGTLSLVTMEPGGAYRLEDIAVESNTMPLAIRKGPDTLAIATYLFDARTAEPLITISVISAQRTLMTGGTITPTLAYSQIYSLFSEDPAERPQFALGDTIFAYTYGGNLHLRSYDGANDLVLEQGVLSIEAENRLSSYWLYLR